MLFSYDNKQTLILSSCLLSYIEKLYSSRDFISLELKNKES